MILISLQKLRILPLVVLTIGIFLVSFAYTEARTVVRTGEQVSIADDQLIEGDLYAAANIVSVSGEVAEDMISAAGILTINGTIGTDALLVGGQVDVHGPVGDDLRVLGGDVIIAEPVQGDVMVLAGSVHILSTASISGDLIIFAGEAEINGSIGGDIFGQVGSVRVDAQVAGDIDVAAESLVVGDRAIIEGGVTYESDDELVRAQNARIDGEIIRNDPVVFGENANSSIQSVLVPILIILFSVAVWFLLSRHSLDLVVAKTLTPSPRTLLLGLITILFGPLAFGILIVSVLGSIVGFVLLLMYVLIMLLSMVGTAAVLGQFVLKAANKPGTLSLIALLIGAVVYTVLLIVPVIGPILLIGVHVLVFGSLVDLLIHVNRR